MPRHKKPSADHVQQQTAAVTRSITLPIAPRQVEETERFGRNFGVSSRDALRMLEEKCKPALERALTEMRRTNEEYEERLRTFMADTRQALLVDRTSDVRSIEHEEAPAPIDHPHELRGERTSEAAAAAPPRRQSAGMADSD
jgi:hypothetical protein